MKNIFATIVFTLLSIAAIPQKTIYTTADSIRIENILQRSTNEGTPSTGEIIIAIANGFIGEKYVGSTLEHGAEEPLFISCTELEADASSRREGIREKNERADCRSEARCRAKRACVIAPGKVVGGEASNGSHKS